MAFGVFCLSETWTLFSAWINTKLPKSTSRKAQSSTLKTHAYVYLCLIELLFIHIDVCKAGASTSLYSSCLTSKMQMRWCAANANHVLLIKSYHSAPQYKEKILTEPIQKERSLKIREFKKSFTFSIYFHLLNIFLFVIPQNGAPSLVCQLQNADRYWGTILPIKMCFCLHYINKFPQKALKWGNSEEVRQAGEAALLKSSVVFGHIFFSFV